MSKRPPQFIPSSSLIEMADNSYYGGFNKSYNNFSLKAGFVTDLYEADDQENVNGRVPEYDVIVFEQDADKGLTPLTYRHCIALDSFGGIGDFFESKKIKPVDQNLQDLDEADGSGVLILCIDGSKERGVIIGALPHPNRKNNLTKDKERHMEGEFNGIRIAVDKDGSIVITQKTATDSKGKPMDTSAAGSQWKMEKDGSTEINTAPLSADLAGGNDLEAEPGSESPEPSANLEYDRIRIDRPSKSIQIEARENIDMVADKNLTAKVEENIDLQMKKDLLMKAEGKANIEVTGTVDFKTDAILKMKMMNLQMTIDNAAQIQMQTMNLIAQQLTVQGGNGLVLTCAQTLINSPLVVLGAQPQPALIMNTNFLGTGNLGIPVISTAIGPFSSQVMLSS